jgi:HEXXH motif-containing protein
MTGSAHQPWHVAGSTFAELAIGGGGRAAVEQLAAAQRAKHVRFLSRIVAATDEAGHPQRQWAVEGRDLLARALQHDLAAAKQAVRHPSVGLWARQTLLALKGQPCPGAEPGGLCAIAAAAAIRAGLSAEITIPAGNGRAMLPSLGVAHVPGPTAVARCADGQATVGDVRLPADPHVDAPGWSGLHRVHAGSIDGQAFDVLIDDIDPFRFPGSERLPGHQPPTSWAETLTGGWAVLRAHHPQVAAEVAAAVSVITPLSGSVLRPVSASSPVVFGTVAMSRPADAVSCAETLTHEVHHMKLGALLDFLPLTEPDDGRRYYAPWRADPRPLGGLLQGAYAYLGVSGFWRRQRCQAGYQEHGDTEFARWRAAANLVVDAMLASGGLSSAGEEFVSGMKRTLQTWLGERVGTAALARAEQAAREHRARWEAAHGPVPS